MQRETSEHSESFQNKAQTHRVVVVVVFLSFSLLAKVIQPKHAETFRPSSHDMKQTASQERGSSR